jgi:hypothetical protein
MEDAIFSTPHFTQDTLHYRKTIAYLSKEADAALKKKILDYRRMTVDEYERLEKERGDGFKEIEETSKALLHYGIYLYDLKSETSRKLTEELPIDLSVVWSPDDKYLLYNDEKFLGHDIHVLDIHTGKREKIASVNGALMAWVNE